MNEKPKLKKDFTAGELADFCVAEAENKIAENIIKIAVSNQTTVADFFILCTANSEPHITAVVNNIERQVREEFGLRPISTAGEAASGWVLIDFGMVVIHVMTEGCRERYQLESLWSELPSLSDLEKAEEMANLRK